MILEVRNLSSGYHRKEVLHDVSLRIQEKEIVALIGHNGAGKTTLLKTVFGLLPARNGTIIWQGEDITLRGTSNRVREGICYVPQGGGVFPDLTVNENLLVAGNIVERQTVLQDAVREVHAIFPRLEERAAQNAGTLSGGERQMLAIGMALVRKPNLIMLDEPSLGLAPVLVQRVMETVLDINRKLGVTILLVEQNVKHALKIATRAYVLKVGRVIHEEEQVHALDHEKLWKLF